MVRSAATPRVSNHKARWVPDYAGLAEPQAECANGGGIVSIKACTPSGIRPSAGH
jgi:hypothetical protein